MTAGVFVESRGGSPARFSEVFAVREFRWLWLAEAQSVVGDQLARVALAVLVFDRTRSAGWTAITYALTYLPDLVGGPLLSGLADRNPRRRVMMTADLIRAALVGLMAVPGLPLPLVAGLLVAVQLGNAPFKAAQAGTLPAVLVGDRYVVGQAVRQITGQSAQLLGFAGGGVLVALLGTSEALAIDAASFAASALLIRFGVRARPAPNDGSGERGSHLTHVATGAWIIWRDPRLRALVGLAWLAGFVIVPEGLAVPYTAEIGAGPATAGLLLACHPAGLAVGALVVSRWLSPPWRLRLMGPLAVGAVLPLLGFAVRPELVAAMALMVLSGACGAYQVTASHVRAARAGRCPRSGIRTGWFRPDRGTGTGHSWRGITRLYAGIRSCGDHCCGGRRTPGGAPGGRSMASQLRSFVRRRQGVQRV